MTEGDSAQPEAAPALSAVGPVLEVARLRPQPVQVDRFFDLGEQLRFVREIPGSQAAASAVGNAP